MSFESQFRYSIIPNESQTDCSSMGSIPVNMERFICECCGSSFPYKPKVCPKCQSSSIGLTCLTAVEAAIERDRRLRDHGEASYIERTTAEQRNKLNARRRVKIDMLRRNKENPSRRGRRIRVLCVETGEIFPTLIDALAAKFGIGTQSQRTLLAKCAREGKAFRGLMWKILQNHE